MSFSHFLAFGFLTWGFFWAGMGLVSVPIVIHLLNRRRFKVVSWAAMEFLLRAMRKNRRRLRFEQWLLLATRCMLLFLLGLALARPLGCESGALAQFGRRTSLNVFIIDNSYSTAYEISRPEAKTHLEQAKNLVKKLLTRPTSGGESAIIITAGKPATAVVGKPQFDLEDAKAAVGRIEQWYGATDLAGALELAMKAAKDETNQPNKNLYLITDGTRSAWESSQAQAIKQAGPELAKYFHVTHFNLTAGQQQWNGAVLDVTPSSNLVTTRFQTDFKAVLKGFGGSHDGTLQWKLDDQLLEGGGPIHLDAATPEQVQSKARFTTGGPHVLSVQLMDEDHLSVDNSRSRVLEVAAELKVLIVEGKRGISPLEGSGAFLSAALAPMRVAEPGKPPRSDSYVSPELITDFELGNKVLTDYSALVLAGVGNLTPQQGDSLANFVKQGGTLMLFMGDAVDRDNYNNVLLPRKLLPGRLVKLMSVGTDEKPYLFDFKAKGVLHPFLGVFSNQENTGLDTATVFTYLQADLDPKIGAERVLSYLPRDPKTAPDPAITVQTLGQGRIVFVSTTANADWTSFPNKLAYVPLMHELLAGSVKTGDAWMNLLVGQSMEIPQTVRVTSSPTLTDPTGAPPVVIDPEQREGRTIYHTGPLKKPGLYKLSLGERQVPIAVNVPAAEEANVTTLPDEAVRHALGDIDMSMQGSDVPSEAAAGREGNDFSWWCMVLVLGLLLFECYLAMRFGHYHRSESQNSQSISAGGKMPPVGAAR